MKESINIMKKNNYVLTISCPDKIGIVSNVATFLYEKNCNIIESAQFGDLDNGMFFMRVSFQSISNKKLNLVDLEKSFLHITNNFEMNSNFYDMATKAKVVIMVSKFGHCLNNILFQWKSKMLNIEIPAIISNHKNLLDMVKPYGIPFVYMPISNQNKLEQEDKLLDVIKEKKIDLIVLARYMQILSPETSNKLKGNIINIHHSFLPSFKGARPYNQAYVKGVKIIGATAHYVTEQLDEGQIIEQDIARVSHNNSLEDFVSIGRDIENIVLMRSLIWHTEHRVLVNGKRTIVFH